MKKISIFMVLLGFVFLLNNTTAIAERNKQVDKYTKIIVVSKVIEALGKIKTPEPEIREVFRNALKSQEYLIRKAAVDAIANMRDKKSVPFVRKLIKDKNVLVRISAIVALASLGEENMDDLIYELLKHEDPNVRNRAVREVEKLGGRFAVSLFEMLVNEKDANVKVSLILALGRRMKFVPALPYIRQLSNDEHSQVRQAACSAIGSFQDTESIPYLIKRLEDDNTAVRVAAKLVLSNFKDISQVELFQKELGNDNQFVSMASYIALANMGEIDIIPTLLKQAVASESNIFRRMEAVRALMILKPKVYALIEESLKNNESLKGISVIDNLEFEYKIDGRTLVSIYTDALNDEDNPFFHDAPILLNIFRDISVLPVLRDALEKDDPDLIAAIAFVLGEFADREAGSKLIEIFKKYQI